MAVSYFFIHVCLALENIGFFQELGSKKKSVHELAGTLGMSDSILMSLIDFLAATSRIIEKNGDLVSVRQAQLPNSLWVIQAYRPVFEGLVALLKGEKVYGKDVVRDGYYLQKASDIFSGDAIRLALSLIEDDKATLIDFGCGSGESLVAFCRKNNSRTAVGLDIDPVIVAAARRHAEEFLLQKRIGIFQADVADIGQWSARISPIEPNIFLASTMLHEFLRDGECSVIDFLARLKSAFPRSRLIVIEFDGIPFDRLHAEADPGRRHFAAMYQLWHPLTNQGMPQPRAVWMRILSTAGWAVRGTHDAKHKLLVFFFLFCFQVL